LLQHAVASVRAQKLEDIEIVISDNASDENYGEYVRSLNDPRIIYFRQPAPVPVTDNWRKTLALATGDYVLMLGDDDALAPQFADIVQPHFHVQRPDVAYLAGYHYCYPGIMPGNLSGYLAAVRCEFLKGDPAPFSLVPSYARELAASVLEFRHRFNFNGQHFLLKKTFADSFQDIGGLYQSPYPDFFSAVALFWRASQVLVLPTPSVVIGISPKSFGAYYFSQRQAEGYKFLDNENLTPEMRDFVARVAWPGDRNNTNWLISAEMARRALGPTELPQVDVERYQAIQLVSLLRDKYWHGQDTEKMIEDVASRLSPRERAAFAFLRAALHAAAQRDKYLLVPMLQAVEEHLGQYPSGFYQMLSIGRHSHIGDALRWLGREGSGAVHNPQAFGGAATRLPKAAAAITGNRPVAQWVWQLGGSVVRKTMPQHAGRIASILRQGPRGILRGVGRRITRLIGAGATAGPTHLQPFESGFAATSSDVQIAVHRGAERCVLTPGLFDDFEFQHGDELQVIPAAAAGKLIRTPEGNLHMRARDGTGIRVPARMEFTSFRGYQMPEHLARLTGAGSETFEKLGAAHIANYRKYVGLEPGMSFLEIGSGMGRDAFQLIDVLGPSGKYIGIDVQRESIVWCQKNISRDHPKFKFVHFDAMHELHNPLGRKTTVDFPLPAADGSIDRVALQSVLTHIFEDEVVHYLREIARVLKPSGLAYVTFLLYSEEIVAASRKNNLTAYGLRFEHKYGDGCYVDNAQYPTGGVAYTDEAMQRMIRKAGLRLVRPYLKGQWSGYHAQPDDDGQDVAILGPARPAPRS
jgi:ubiquinone/menaquinone biosynthesis C-methylase UbiE/glycosyltransferase involved in cell wall biosynthesis